MQNNLTFHLLIFIVNNNTSFKKVIIGFDPE